MEYKNIEYDNSVLHDTPRNWLLYNTIKGIDYQASKLEGNIKLYYELCEDINVGNIPEQVYSTGLLEQILNEKQSALEEALQFAKIEPNLIQEDEYIKWYNR